MKEITAKEVEQKLANGETPNIIDVREVDEVAEGKNSRNYAYSTRLS